MSLFHSILSGLQKKIAHNQVNLTDISEIVSTTIGTRVTESQIVVQKNTLRITAPAIVLLSVHLKRQLVIQNLQEKGYRITTIVQ